MRLIDADTLHDELKAKQKWVVRRGEKHNEGYTYDQVHFAIDDAPTVNAEPVRHGKWIGGELGECSVCGHHGCASDIWNGCANQYCPNCGARMDGGTNGTD